MKFALTILAILGFGSIGSLKAREYLNCASEENCRCSNPADLRFETTIAIRDSIATRKIYECMTLNIQPIFESIWTEPYSGIPFFSPSCFESAPLENLFERATATFPQGCGYSISDFNARGFRENIQRFIDTGRISCEGYNSMCTSAAFFAFLLQLRQLEQRGLITREQFLEWADIHSDPYMYINAQARPDLMLSTIGLGEGRTMRRGEFPQEGWPREGDFVQFWRRNNSGHSTVFSGFLKDETGRNIGICFWSSNRDTRGYGKFCEDIDVIDRIIVGRVTR